MVLVAVIHDDSAQVPCVQGFRSNRGKLLLDTSTLNRWPRETQPGYRSQRSGRRNYSTGSIGIFDRRETLLVGAPTARW